MVGAYQRIPKKWLTPGFIADYCQVSRGTVLQWVKDGKLKGFSLPSGHHRIDKRDFRDFLESYGMPVEECLFESKSKEKGGKK